MVGWIGPRGRRNSWLARSRWGGLAASGEVRRRRERKQGRNTGGGGKRGGGRRAGEESVGVLTCSHFAPRYEKEY
jgi:hypothetical protein